ncbi:hypothetical protein [Piscicoccus intestinalis]|uniref:hypothetical protein n=1 Tax=Piscicoccus intestinalis TaxID=746033 RepID=UPI00083985EA|nr:hypothetical protein [Piscicoccus intestinalis]
MSHGWISHYAIGEAIRKHDGAATVKEIADTMHARALRRLTLSDSPALVELLAWIEDQEVEPP